MDERKDVKSGKENETYKRIKELTEKGYGLIETAMDISPENENTDEEKEERKLEEES